VLAALALVSRAAGGMHNAACLVEWRVAGHTGLSHLVHLQCRDGDPSCDADGTVDGTCTFDAALCLNVPDRGLPGCVPGILRSVHVRGRDTTAFARAALHDLAFPIATANVCTAEAPLRVRVGPRRRRTIAVRAWVRDTHSRRIGRARLRLTCEQNRAASTAPAKAIVVTTDFETGLLATVGVTPPHTVDHFSTPIHSDAVVRTAGGLVYVVNRFLGDNVQVLDPAHGFNTVAECSVGPGSNPHDLAVVNPHKAYVTRYGRPELWIVDPGVGTDCAGFFLGAIDLGRYAAAGNLPEMDQMALVGDRLFVSLERLDTALRFPAGKGLLVVIDITTDQVVSTIELSGGNPFGETAGLPREPGTGNLLVSEAGDIYRTGDGGIERVDPFALRAEGFFITETDLGGNITDFVLLSPTKGYAVVEDDSLHNILLAFDPQTRRVTRRLFVSQQYLPEIDLAPDQTLWLADRALPNPGIRIFDVTDDRELTPTPIDVGLPPFAMAFLP